MFAISLSALKMALVVFFWHMFFNHIFPVENQVIARIVASLWQLCLKRTWNVIWFMLGGHHQAVIFAKCEKYWYHQLQYASECQKSLCQYFTDAGIQLPLCAAQTIHDHTVKWRRKKNWDDITPFILPYQLWIEYWYTNSFRNVT